MNIRIFFIVGVLALTFSAITCSQSEPNTTPSVSESTTSPTQSSGSMNMGSAAAVTVVPSLVPSSVTNSKTQSVSSVTLVVVSGTTAKYSIGEKLTRFDTTAIGITQEVVGELAFDSDGNILAGSSITIDSTSFKSDESRRDNWISRNGGLGQEITFVVTEVKEMPWPLPTSGSTAFVIVGDMTVSETTASIAWEAIADFSGDEITGIAKTSISWDQFNLSKPRLPFIISVDDNIFLELSFKTSH